MCTQAVAIPPWTNRSVSVRSALTAGGFMFAGAFRSCSNIREYGASSTVGCPTPPAVVASAWRACDIVSGFIASKPRKYCSRVAAIAASSGIARAWTDGASVSSGGGRRPAGRGRVLRHPRYGREQCEGDEAEA